MKNNKMVYVAIGVVVFSIILMGTVLFFSFKGNSDGKMTNSMNAVANSYVGNLNSGKYEEAYKSVSSMTSQYVDVESFNQLMGVVMGEKDARLEIDETVAVKNKEVAVKDGKIICTEVPVKRVYEKQLDGESNTVTEEYVIDIIEQEDGYKVYIPETKYYDDITKYILGKANENAVRALENKNTQKIVEESCAKIDEYLLFAQKIPSSYENYDEVLMQIELITAYKLLAQGDDESALNKIQSAHNVAQTEKQKMRVYRVESEIHFARGQYSKAAEVLKTALEMSPNDEDARRDYRRINSMMLEQIEATLVRGWSQVHSAIKQDEKEMKRILEDIALVEADNSIKIKEDAPDGYYLKGNIQYCLGDYHGAIQSLEKAIELSKMEDTEFKTRAAEILGMSKVAQASSKKELDVSSYEKVFNKDVRSLLFRGNEVSGIVDTIQ